MSPEQLLTRAADGDEVAFAALYDALAPAACPGRVAEPGSPWASSGFATPQTTPLTTTPPTRVRGGITAEVDGQLQHCLHLIRAIQHETERLTCVDACPIDAENAGVAESLEVDVSAIVNQIHLSLRQMRAAVSSSTAPSYLVWCGGRADRYTLPPRTAASTAGRRW